MRWAVQSAATASRMSSSARSRRRCSPRARAGRAGDAPARRIRAVPCRAGRWECPGRRPAAPAASRPAAPCPRSAETPARRKPAHGRSGTSPGGSRPHPRATSWDQAYPVSMRSGRPASCPGRRANAASVLQIALRAPRAGSIARIASPGAAAPDRRIARLRPWTGLGLRRRAQGCSVRPPLQMQPSGRHEAATQEPWGRHEGAVEARREDRSGTLGDEGDHTRVPWLSRFGLGRGRPARGVRPRPPGTAGVAVDDLLRSSQ